MEEAEAGVRPPGWAGHRIGLGIVVLVGGLVAGLASGAGTPAGAAHPAASCGPTVPKLTVQGTGQATATPDLLTLVVQVDASGASATTALAADNTKASAAVTALKFGGVAAKDIQTSGLSLQPQYAYPKGVPTVTGYQVTNTITATLRQISKSGAILDGVVGVAGNAVQIESVSFSLSNPGNIEDLARSRAAAQAVMHAKALARAAGRSLGTVCSLTDQSQLFSPLANAGLTYQSAVASPAVNVPIESGSETQSAQVSLVYALEPMAPHRTRR
jgi:uncharacterized protein YggE